MRIHPVRLVLATLLLGAVLSGSPPVGSQSPSPGPPEPGRGRAGSPHPVGEGRARGENVDAATGLSQAGYYSRRGRQPAAPPASPTPSSSRDGKGSSSGGAERRLVYEFFIFDVLLCLVTVVVTRDAWLSDRMRLQEGESLPWQADRGEDKAGGTPSPLACTRWVRRMQESVFGSPRGLAGLVGVLVLASITVTLVLYGRMLGTRLGPGHVPDMAARSVPIPFSSTAPRVVRPYRMPGIFLAVSSDGVRWEKQPAFRATRGGTHKMVLGPDGRVWAYVADAEHAPERAEVTSQGLADVARVEIAEEPQRPALDPCPVLLEAKPARYRLYYLCTNRAGDPAAADARNEVHSAISDDGIHFRREGGVRLAGRGLTDPDVVRLPDGTWRMYYTEFPGSIKSAHSRDGLVFAEEGLRFANASVSSSLVEPDGTTRLWCQSLDAHLRGAIQAASARDGRAFVIVGRDVVTAGRLTEPDGHGAYHPAVVRLGDGRYWMLYSSGEVLGGRASTEGAVSPASR